MNKFVLIDHSIKRIGGHNYEYAFHVLTAAERQGFRPILAVNRRFFERPRLPASWRLHTAFRHTTYEDQKLASKQQFYSNVESTDARAPRHDHARPRSLRGLWIRALPCWLRRGLARRLEAQRRRISARYTTDLTALFAQLNLCDGDQVFLPTLSQSDLAGLLDFYRANAATASRVDWHLQFHFKVYEGRQADYDAQDSKLVELRQQLKELASVLPSERMHFYTTTATLADQYRRLGLANISALPYPVNPALLRKPAPAKAPARPLRVTCAGAVRTEKGLSLLHRAVGPLWNDYFDPGRLQLVVQARRIGKLPAELRPHARFDRDAQDSRRVEQPPKVAVVRWPLSTEQYLRLIRHSDIGLFLYDADEYFARCSGVLVEMLKAAVPVIVPAGCWMAEQIAEPIYAHRDQLLKTMPILARLTAADADWEAGRAQRYYIWRPDARLLVGGEGGALAARMHIPPGATHLCVRFHWSASTAPGSYVELAAKQDDVPCGSIARETVGVRASGGPVPIMLPIHARSRQIQLQWRNAFGSHTLALENLEYLFLSAGSNSCPLGAVGLISADIEDVPRLLRDIADHYQHYRRSAESFAPDWGEWHSPAKVVRLLSQGTQGVAQDRRFAA